ncbi:MAG: hypothetical protein ACRD72_22330 [Candidatus Angelobacter sp.]
MEAKYWFFLALASIFVAYYVGTVADINAIFPWLYKLANLSFGRNAQGNYPGYPK